MLQDHARDIGETGSGTFRPWGFQALQQYFHPLVISDNLTAFSSLYRMNLVNRDEKTLYLVHFTLVFLSSLLE